MCARQGNQCVHSWPWIISAERKCVFMSCVWGGFSDFSPNGSPHFIINSGGDLAGLIYESLIVCNSARITIQKTICGKVQIAPRNDIGREWDLFLLSRLSVGQTGALWTPGWQGEPLGPAPCVGADPPLLLADGREMTLGSTHIFLLLLCRRQKLWSFWVFERRNWPPLWTAASMLVPSSWWRTHFSSFGCACGPKGNIEDFLENIMTSVLGQSVTFSVALPHHPLPV